MNFHCKLQFDRRSYSTHALSCNELVNKNKILRTAERISYVTLCRSLLSTLRKQGPHIVCLITSQLASRKCLQLTRDVSVNPSQTNQMHAPC